MSSNVFYIILASSFALLIMSILLYISFKTLKKKEEIINKLSDSRKK